ncbi:MAG TPA: iron-sulfur cluster insertion protein ErpA [Bacillota bacterium]
MITLTAEAGAKIKQVLAERKKDPNTGLRIFVQEGGCSGFSYGLKFESNPSDEDRVIEQHGVKVIVDPVSAMYLEGATIDYVENLMGGGFTIKNPNATQTCGCGQSFRTSQASGKPQPCDS